MFIQINNFRQKSNVRIHTFQVYVAPKAHVVEEEIIHEHYKPRKHHFRKTAFLGGYVNGQGDIVGPPPQISKRIDANVDASANVEVAAGGSHNGGVGTTYTKEVTIEKNPTFFADIFNVSILSADLNCILNFIKFLSLNP